MRKHLLGFAIFSLIVGMSAFIFLMFKAAPVEEISAPNYSFSSPAKSCWKMKRNSEAAEVGLPIIKQAVFNFKRKQIKLELANTLSGARVNLPLVLQFFRKDSNGTKYIASEHIQFLPESNYDRAETGSLITGSYDWLRNLDSYENLYVNAEYDPSSRYYRKNLQPEFDAISAVPVLLDYEK